MQASPQVCCSTPSSRGAANGMQQNDTPFSGEWLGQRLGDVRPGPNTYNAYPTNSLPKLQFEFRGDFRWLADLPTAANTIGPVPDADVALTQALLDAGHLSVGVPETFISFVRRPDLQQRVRSCTDCYLDISPGLAVFESAGGYLLRFLADSQGCVFWYLFLRSDGQHCVVSSGNWFGAERESRKQLRPSIDAVRFCEQSFESFLCRFWLENRIWLSLYEKRPLSPEAQGYVDAYRG
jgi:hypothetical protein